MTEQATLYKLMILYMLRQIDFSLTLSQMSDFVLGKGYTDYFQLQNAIADLTESGLIHQEKVRSISYYTITPEGEQTLDYFEGRLSPGLKEDMKQYLRDNRVRMRDEVSAVADYYPGPSGDYLVHCQVRERKSALMDMTLSVPEESMAKAICDQWKSRNQEIYAYVMKELMQ